MKRPLSLAALALFAVACTERTAVGPTARDAAPVAGPAIGPQLGPGANNGNGILHRVSAGGHDADLFPGDKNYSLIAIQHGDGSVTGQWIDMFGKDPNGNPLGGIHVDVDCLSVVGNRATIGGVIKNGTSQGVDVTGQRALTRVWDFGKSANDPPDAISFSFFPTGNLTCTQQLNFPLLVMTDGQVTVD